MLEMSGKPRNVEKVFELVVLEEEYKERIAQDNAAGVQESDNVVEAGGAGEAEDAHAETTAADLKDYVEQDSSTFEDITNEGEQSPQNRSEEEAVSASISSVGVESKYFYGSKAGSAGSSKQDAAADTYKPNISPF